MGFSLEKRSPGKDILSFYNYMKGVCNQVRFSVFSQVTGQEEIASSCTRGGLGSGEGMVAFDELKGLSQPQ